MCQTGGEATAGAGADELMLMHVASLLPRRPRDSAAVTAARDGLEKVSKHLKNTLFLLFISAFLLS